jgi:pyridinium-3,5-bisthiocarboxylic acid mononucleotide nickel chelatase
LIVRIAYFDPFSGASGDMVLGALVDAGTPVAEIAAMLGGLGLPGWALSASPADQHGIHGTRVSVVADDGAPARDWAVIRSLIEESILPIGVREASLAIFGKLAEAEAAVHGSTPDQVHFHEVGGIDAIVDICGACCALAILKIDAVYSGPPRTGSGFAKSQHGIIPIPAPATAKLLALAGAPLPPPDPIRDAVPGELLTPTGAAILTTLAEFTRPGFSPTAIGYGFGQKELPWPNALRVWIGETEDDAPASDGEVLIETNIDDMSPQHVELLMERLFAAGALDVWTTPIMMKKGRPAIMVSALGPASKQEQISATMIVQSTTLGVRVQSIARTKAIRRIETVTTKWGDVRVKIRGWNGRVIDIAPEYDDCASIARSEEVPLRDVWNEAHRMAEVYVGLRIGDDGEWPVARS